MDLFFALVSTALASFIWLYLIRILDVFHPEKWIHIVVFFGLGIGSVSLPLAFSYWIDLDSWIPNELLEMFLSAAVLEEISKLGFLLLGMQLLPRLKEDPCNWMIYGATVGIGFGAIENVLYAHNYGNSVLHYREILSLTGHALFTGVGSFGLYCYVQGKKNKTMLWILAGILLHGFYNAPFIAVKTGDLEWIQAFAITCTVYLLAIELFTVLLNNVLNQSQLFRDNVALPMTAVRRSTFTMLFLLQLLFLVHYKLDNSTHMIGDFLIITLPLILLMQVLVARLTSLVLVKRKEFDVMLSFPFAMITPDLDLPVTTGIHLRMRGLPYDESEFVRFIGNSMRLYPLSSRSSYFGDQAEVFMMQKVYAKSQILFYNVQFKSSADPIDENRHYYILPKFMGKSEVGKFRIAALIYREEPIDNSTEDFGIGAFCCWVKIPLEKPIPWWKEFYRLLHAKP